MASTASEYEVPDSESELYAMTLSALDVRRLMAVLYHQEGTGDLYRRFAALGAPDYSQMRAGGITLRLAEQRRTFDRMDRVLGEADAIEGAQGRGR